MRLELVYPHARQLVVRLRRFEDAETVGRLKLTARPLSGSVSGTATRAASLSSPVSLTRLRCRQSSTLTRLARTDSADQISQRVRGRDVSTFLDPPALDQQASEAVELGLAVLHGLAQLNTPPANSQTPLAESRASPDVIAAADRSHAIILRLRDVLRSSHGALAAGQNALTPRRQDPQAAAAPADMPLFQAWNDGQAIPDFPAVWAGDDEFMDNLLQRKSREGPQLAESTRC